VDPADGSRVLCHCHWQEPERTRRAGRLTLVLVHGLEGSSDSRYIQGIAARAWDAGCNVIRMNMRNCGGTEALTPTLYHSGLSGDVGAVVRHYAERFGLERWRWWATRWAATWCSSWPGSGAVGRRLPPWPRFARPSIWLRRRCPARTAQPGYEWHFLRGLMARYTRKAKQFPGIYAPLREIGPVNSIRQFDNKIVARYWNFRDADDYYYRAASARVVDRIAVPTLILCAQDDPFIRLTAGDPRQAARQQAHRLCGDPPRRPLRLSFQRPGQRDSLGGGGRDSLFAG
jgi:uncharacterized protein